VIAIGADSTATRSLNPVFYHSKPRDRTNPGRYGATGALDLL